MEARLGDEAMTRLVHIVFSYGCCRARFRPTLWRLRDLGFLQEGGSATLAVAGDPSIPVDRALGAWLIR